MGNNQSSKQNPTILTNEAMQLLLANTKFNEREIIEWHAGFIRDCPDGKLTESKFKQVSKSLFPNKNTDNLCHISFKTFDMDGNGTIDFYEFLYAIAILQKGDLKERLKLAFDMYDTDKNGTLDAKELTSILKILYSTRGEKGDPKKKAAEIIKKADISGDKKIDIHEFIHFLVNDAEMRRLLDHQVTALKIISAEEHYQT